VRRHAEIKAERRARNKQANADTEVVIEGRRVEIIGRALMKPAS